MYRDLTVKLLACRTVRGQAYVRTLDRSFGGVVVRPAEGVRLPHEYERTRGPATSVQCGVWLTFMYPGSKFESFRASWSRWKLFGWTV